MVTSYSTKYDILAEVYLEASWNEQLDEFRITNDIGLPLAYMISKEISTASFKGELFIEETWHKLCDSLGVDQSKSYKDANELLEKSKFNKGEK